MRRAILLTLSTLALAAGCSGDGDEPLSKPEYERRLNTVLTGFGEDVLKLGSAVSRAPTPDLAAGRMETLRTRLDEAADQLDDVAPPDDVTEPHAQLVEGVRELSDEVGGYEDEASVALRDFKRLESFFDELVTSAPAQKVSGATRAIQEKGYELGANAGES